MGVDAVARAKGHNYMTVIYDMEKGHLIGVETGRTAYFFWLSKVLPKKTALKIEAVTMDMKPAYQKSVRNAYPMWILCLTDSM
ncbi:MAG: transposase [Cellvibrionaceae bacterium]|jgi:transposase